MNSGICYENEVKTNNIKRIFFLKRNELVPLVFPLRREKLKKKLAHNFSPKLHFIMICKNNHNHKFLSHII